MTSHPWAQRALTRYPMNQCLKAQKQTNLWHEDYGAFNADQRIAIVGLLEYFSARQVAEMYSISKTTVYTWAKQLKEGKKQNEL